MLIQEKGKTTAYQRQDDLLITSVWPSVDHCPNLTINACGHLSDQSARSQGRRLSCHLNERSLDGMSCLVVRSCRYPGEVWKDLNNAVRALVEHWQNRSRCSRRGCEYQSVGDAGGRPCQVKQAAPSLGAPMPK